MGKDVGVKDVELIICDTYGYLTTESKELTFKSIEERKEYIKQVQAYVKDAQKYLIDGKNEEKERGSSLVGVNNFSFSSLGEDIFTKEYAKRVLVWNKDLDIEEGNEYTNDRAFFMWGVTGSGWIYHLQEDEKLHRGEFLQKDYEDAQEFVRTLIRRFSNEGSKIMEIVLHEGSVVEEAAKLEGREYVVYKGDM